VFVLDPFARDAVSFTQCAVGVHKELRDDEDGDSLCSRGIPFDTGKYRVDDILHEVELTVRNENLVSSERESPIRISDRRCGESPNVRPGLGFSEQHSAAPFCRGQVFHVHRLLLRCAELVDHIGGAIAHGCVHIQPIICGHEVLCCGSRNEWRGALPTHIFNNAEIVPAAFQDQVESAMKALGNNDLSILVSKTCPVPLGESGKHFLYSQGLCFRKDHLAHLSVIAAVRPFPEKGLSVQLLPYHKILIPFVR